MAPEATIPVTPESKRMDALVRQRFGAAVARTRLDWASQAHEDVAFGIELKTTTGFTDTDAFFVLAALRSEAPRAKLMQVTAWYPDRDGLGRTVGYQWNVERAQIERTSGSTERPTWNDASESYPDGRASGITAALVAEVAAGRKPVPKLASP